MNGTLIWLQDWYRSQCDEEWEHSFGVSIYTIDNPGWGVEIDLSETEFEHLSMPNQLIEKSEDDWYSYSITDKVFHAAGDPSKLEFILNLFKDIVTK